MKLAKDFRCIARERLNGKWLLAILVGIVASILGGILESGSSINFNFENGQLGADLELAGQTIISTTNGLHPKFTTFLVGAVVYILIAAIVLGILYFILGSIISVGYAKFNLNLIDQEDCSFENLFAYFGNWKVTACTRLLQNIFTVLWSLLFVIPGIMASYSYAMTSYILAENPSLRAREAIRMSKEMMRGNRWRLFCLHVSFIGWRILCFFTFGIGNYLLNPYVEAANAAFYREISGSGDYEYDIYE